MKRCEVCGSPNVVAVSIPAATFYLCLIDLRELTKACKEALKEAQKTMDKVAAAQCFTEEGLRWMQETAK